MTRYELWFLLLLATATVATGVAVAYAKYLSRTEFVELQALRAQRHELEVQWEQLRLEEAALTTQARIESKARELLGMHLPQRNELRVIDGGRDAP